MMAALRMCFNAAKESILVLVRHYFQKREGPRPSFDECEASLHSSWGLGGPPPQSGSRLPRVPTLFVPVHARVHAAFLLTSTSLALNGTVRIDNTHVLISCLIFGLSTGKCAQKSERDRVAGVAVALSNFNYSAAEALRGTKLLRFFLGGKESALARWC